LTFVDASYPTEARDRAYAALAAAAPGDLANVWLCNSGTEANEAALKFARSATDATTIVATKQAFHGRTMGALATTWKRAYKEPFEPLIDAVEFVPYGEEAALREVVDDDTAAFIVEPVQGEGGVTPAPAGYLETARAVTEAHDAALIFDEVQTGMGRTGTMWACQARNVVPDILTTAKGLGNGLPVGATVVADWVAEDAGSHNATFSGGPVVSAALAETVETVIEEEWPAHAGRIGERLRGDLTDRLGDAVRDVRGEAWRNPGRPRVGPRA